jgi:hypothetical protein
MAQLAQNRHRKNAGFRLGRAPYYLPKGLNFVQIDARIKFLEAVNELAPSATRALLELAAAHDFRANRCPFEEWGTQFHLLYQHHIADWVRWSARMTVMFWDIQPPERRFPMLVPMPPLPFGAEATFTPGECRINLPELAWNPLGPVLGAVAGETRAECRDRILELVDAELDRIEQSVNNRGARPCPVKRDLDHFRWSVRFQVNGEPVQNIAHSPDHARTIRAAIGEVLELIGLDKRQDRRGRPSKNR